MTEEKELDLAALAVPVPPEDRPSFGMALAVIGQDTQPEDLEAFCATLAIERVPFWILRLKEIEAAAEKVRTMLETEWGLRAAGLSWTHPDSGDRYDYKGSSRGGFKEIPDLVAQLLKRGLTVDDLARAISGLRVTDLEAAADERLGLVAVCSTCRSELDPVRPHDPEHPDDHSGGPCDGPYEVVKRGDLLREIVRDHYSYTSGPKHLTKYEPLGHGRRRKEATP